MNNKTQFTPGPWIVETTNTLPGECADNVHRLCYPGYRIHGICAIWNNTRTSKANATLIAAAPAMYEALQSLTSEIDLSKLNIRKDFSLMNAHACAVKAILQAEGKLL